VASEADQDLYAAGLAQAKAGRLAEAAQTLASHVAARPEDRPGWAALGGVQLRLGRLADAANSYGEALRLAPDDPALHLARGNALARLGAPLPALPHFERAAALDPRPAGALSNLAHVLNRLDRPEEALAAAARALALNDALALAWRQRGAALFKLGRPDEAAESHRAALARVGPGAGERAGILSDLAQSLTSLGEYEPALEALEAALALAPDHLEARRRRANLRLMTGDFEGGWDDYEERWRGATDIVQRGKMSPGLERRLLLRPRVEDLAGRDVLVVGEQGVGDEVMFASVLPDLAAVAGRVTCLVFPKLRALMASSFPGIDFVGLDGPAGAEFERREVTVAMGSLPYAFRRSGASFPGAPYLVPEQATAQRWADRLGPRRARLRLGVSWRGGLKATGAAARSMPLATLMPLLTRPDLEVVSLQYGDVSDELAAVNAGLASPLRAFAPAEIDDFQDLAGLVANLDVVVTVQTALAHLTGALGRPGLVMIPERPEWRYGASGEAMPWYRSLRLVRQGPGEGWAPVVRRVGVALEGSTPP
jgi:Tfp pilus assembly protein PilF